MPPPSSAASPAGRRRAGGRPGPCARALLLLPPGVGGEELALLLQLIAQLLDVSALGVHLPLHGRLLLLELLARGHACGPSEPAPAGYPRTPRAPALGAAAGRAEVVGTPTHAAYGDRPPRSARSRSPPLSASFLASLLCHTARMPSLECRSHGEAEGAEVLALLRIRVHAVVDADRPEGRTHRTPSPMACFRSVMSNLVPSAMSGPQTLPTS